MEHPPPNPPKEIIIDGGSQDEIRFTKIEGRGQALVYEANMSDVIGFSDTVRVSPLHQPEVSQAG